MKTIIKLKRKLFEACLLFVNNRLATVTHVIESSKKALQSETKSSAGDKHETGRAMIQLEMEKAGQQLAEINLMKAVLDKIDGDKSAKVACLGSLIKTSKANYFLAISAGKITVDNKTYFAVSTNSPIGKQLLGKKVGEIIPFNKAEILEVY
jgi:transcription elongation GreA/GreB family factor